MRVRIVLLTVLILVVVFPPSTLSHHSRAAEFDERLPVSFEGVVASVDWRNPHIWIFVDETQSDDEVVHWEAEAGSNPIGMARNGWKRDTLKPGDEVRVEGIRAYCCENVMSIGTIRRANGEQLFAGRAPQ